MRHDVSVRTLAVTMLAVLAVCCVVPIASETDADVVYSKEVTCYYYSVGMSWAGQEAEAVTWDFGDGSPIETGFSVTHRYSEIGDYTVTLTGTNPNGSDVKYYMVHIMGYPVVSFESNGGSYVDPIQMTSGGNGAVASTEPEAPSKPGYTFAGWYSDVELTQPYDWSKVVSESITLYAAWMQDTVYRTVSFDVDGGSVAMDDVIVIDGDDMILPLYSGERVGYDFSGWMVGDVRHFAGDSVTVTSDITVRAVWTLRQYTVSFDSDVPSQLVDHGMTAVRPQDPVREGHTFVQWILDGVAYDFTTPVTGNISLVAEWRIDSYTVTFDSDVPAQTVEHGQRAEVPAEPTRVGYDFIRWILDGEAFDFDTPITSDISLVAEWRIRTFTVSFDSGVESQSVEYGSTATEPAEPTRLGYTFVQWTLDGVGFSFLTPITRDISLVAEWEPIYTPDPTYTVTFDTDGGSPVSKRTVTEGSKVTMPAAPVKEGFTFVSWYLGDAVYDFDTPVTGDITLKAVWKVNEYTVTFDTDGGSEVPSQKVEHGKTVTQPQAPTKDGCTFDGWYLGDSEYGFDEPVTSNITITAHWTQEVPGEPTEEEGMTIIMVLILILIVVAIVGFIVMRL